MKSVREFSELQYNLLFNQKEFGFGFTHLCSDVIDKERTKRKVSKNYNLIYNSLEYIRKSYDAEILELINSGKFDCDVLELVRKKSDKENFDTKITPPEVIFLNSPMACQLAAVIISQLYIRVNQMYVGYHSDYNQWLKKYLESNLFNQLEADSVVEIQKYVSYDMWSEVWGKVKLAILKSIERQPVEAHARYKLDANEFTIQRPNRAMVTFEYKNEMESYGVFDMILFVNFCIVSEFPAIIKRNAEGKIHSESSSAIEWRDGFGLYYWNGIKVPKEWIVNKDSITADTILTEKNIERRRCLMEILGHELFFKLLNVFCLDSTIDECGKPMKLFRSKDLDKTINEYLFYLFVVDPSTNREYFISVPPCYDVHWAKSATFNHQKIQYRQGDVGLLNIAESFEKPIIET